LLGLLNIVGTLSLFGVFGVEDKYMFLLRGLFVELDALVLASDFAILEQFWL
jgi:hypothetical protein